MAESYSNQSRPQIHFSIQLGGAEPFITEEQLAQFSATGARSATDEDIASKAGRKLLTPDVGATSLITVADPGYLIICSATAALPFSFRKTC